MSNEREIRLVGSFKDDITPKLQRLNKQIAATVRQFERLQKRLRPIAKEMGVLAMASERIGNSLRAQRTGFESNIRAMRAYRSEMGRTVAAQQRLTSRTALPQITAAPRVRPSGGTKGGFAGGGGGGGGSAYVHPTQRMSRGGVASTYAPSAQRMPSGGGERGGVGIADGAAGAAFGITLGNQIGSIMTNAVMTGFHKGVELMQKPFKFLAHEFRHAMQEEMADITAAGAMFALDKAGKTGMFKDFEDARMAQEMLDQRLAQSAGRLPGETLQYVQQARQLQDTIMQAMGKDKEGFIKHAEKLGAVPGDMRDAFATVLAQFTERAVLLGMGGGGGRAGGMGVPQLLEQMVGQEAVRVESMGRTYSALRTNPLLKAALERNEAAINATTVGTIERINAIQKALDEALPQEVITAMTMTMNGIAEGFRSSIFDIAAGWFGVRRMMKGVSAATYKMNGEIKQATDSTLSLFDVLRDTIGFFVVPLLELTSILPEIYEPFEGLVNTLVPLRAIGARFTFTFNQFAADYEAFAKEAFPDDFDKQTAFLKNRGPRAALRSIAALLEDFDPGFSADEVSRELLKVDADFGKVAKDMITSLLDSGFMEMVGETMGNFVSELLTVMANLVTGATDFATTSRFAKGFSKGLQGRLDEAGNKLGMGAFEAVRKIFEGVFRIMGKLLLTVITELPMETMLFVGITAVLPAALAALGTKIGVTLSAVLGKAGGMIQASLMGTKVAASGAGAATTAAVTGGTAHAALTGKVAPLAKAAPTQTFGTKALTSLSSAWAQFTAGIKPLFQGIKGAFQGLIKGIKALVAMLQMGDFRSVLTMILSPLKSLGGALKAFSGGGMAGLKALSAMLQMGDFKSVMQMLISPLKIFSQGFKGFGQLLSNGAKGLGKFGGAITAIVAAFNIFSGLLSGKDIWESLGQAAGPVIGTLIGTALLGPIGGVIGGFIGSLEPVTSFFEGVFVGLGDALGPIGESLAEIGHTLWLNLSEMWGVVTNIIPGLKGLGGEFDALRVGITTIKILLFPLTATLDLINVALQGLRIGFLYLQKWIAGIPGIGRLAGDQAEIESELDGVNGKFKESFDRHKQWYTTEIEASAQATAALKDVAGSASQAAGDLKEYQQKTKELIAQGKASGLTPTAADMAEYNRRIAAAGPATRPITPPPAAAPSSPVIQAANPIPAIQTLSQKQDSANNLLSQINAKTVRPESQLSPIPAIQTLGQKQDSANNLLSQINAKTVPPQPEINLVPQLQGISSGVQGALAYIAQVTAQTAASGRDTVSQIGESSNAVQARVKETTGAVTALQADVRGTTAAVNNLASKFSGALNVRVINTPTVKMDMGAFGGAVGGSIGKFPKTSGYGMRWGRLHAGNDYAMPVGTKLGIGGPGKVLGAGYWGGYGLAMDIGGPGGMVYRFAHLSKINAPVGANLPPGFPFALSGNTGNSTGPHLHFEARPGGGGPVNPDAFAGIIRANFAGTALGPLMGAMGTEMKNMPYGAQLAVANSDEIFMKPKQMAHVIESSARAGAESAFGIKPFSAPRPDLVAQANDGMIGPSWLPWNWGKLVDQERKTSPLNRTNRMLEQMKRESRNDGGVSEGGSGNYMRSSPVPTMVASAGGSEAGNITTGPITINVDGYDKDPRELTEIIASQLVTAMYKQSRSEVLTS
jgi:murein DD-endopeptidase MepM/ murein hydrolase activator NlpD